MSLSLATKQVVGLRFYANPQQQLAAWSKDYNIIIAGSYLQFNGDDVLNTFSLTFPTGETYYHSKDIPTVIENYCYTNGDTNRVFKTPIGNIALALCWEQIRYNTLRDMNGKVDLILAGSCWWGFTENDPKELQALQNYSNELAVNAPIEMSKLLNAPVIHASHHGIYTGLDFPYGKKLDSREILGATQIIDDTGTVLQKRLYNEDDAILTADLELNINRHPQQLNEKDYWIPKMPPILAETFFKLNDKCHNYYLKYSRNYYQTNNKH